MNDRTRYTTAEFRRLDELFDELFPICRSIAGPGLRESLEIISKHMPLEIEATPTGTKVFDWLVPQEWLISEGRLTGPDGKVYANFERSNLEIVNYSSPVNAQLSWEELRGHLHTIENLPSAIPYVTSYYNKNWGFCIPYQQLNRMPQGNYHAYIDSQFVDGSVNFAHCTIPGETSHGIWLTSYLCHPSLANNELSGPLVLTELYKKISAWKRRRYTYHFVIAPETIGSLCYLARYKDLLINHMVSGMVVTCAGGPALSLSYKLSRQNNSLLDRTAAMLAVNKQPYYKTRPFDPTSGSDERQYCSPGFNLPMGQVSRTVYGTYDGYHNSLDTKHYMNIETLLDSTSKIEELLLCAELSGHFQNLLPFGEPQLGKRGLYPTTNSPANRDASMDQKKDGRKFLDRLLYVLNYSDGEHDMLSIAKMCGCQINDLAPVIRTLEEQGLLQLITKDKASPN